MPDWLQILLWAAAAITATGVVWVKAVLPISRTVTLLTDALPMLRELTHHLADTPHAAEILDEIVKQVRTDHGSSLLDKINNSTAALATLVSDNRVAADVLSSKVEAVKVLAAEDRRNAADLMAQVETIDAGMARLVTVTARLESAVGEVTEALGRIEASHLAETMTEDRELLARISLQLGKLESQINGG